jgi:hypothetical protein
MTESAPETDAQAEEMLSDGKLFSTGNALCGIYRIMRERDGMSVFDSYVATLNHWIGVIESRAR